nr:MAG TPA: NICKEL-COBALT-CADMIUM RESISTANCE PROTEIN NCCX BINDING PROTEIN, MEMBRANE PROTEIN [Caudoviricetes sp.]
MKKKDKLVVLLWVLVVLNIVSIAIKIVSLLM